MGSRERAIDVGTARAGDLIIRAGHELRQARMDRGLSLASVGQAASLSVSQVSRIERAAVPGVSVRDLARLHAVVGLELSLKSFTAGQPIRDAPQLRLSLDFRALLHRSLGWATEVPLPLHGDQRAWDTLIRGPAWRFGVECETAPRDAQALVRRLQLKQRDGDVDGVILVLRRTVQTRRFIAEARDVLLNAFPSPAVRAVELLRAGLRPEGNTLIILDRHGAPARWP